MMAGKNLFFWQRVVKLLACFSIFLFLAGCVASSSVKAPPIAERDPMQTDVWVMGQIFR